MRLAIIQNQIGVDGRSVVVAEVIRVCNEHGVVPVIFSFTRSRDLGVFREEYGHDINFELRSFKGVNITRGTAYQTPMLNVLASSEIKKFHMVFNSGRCPYFLPSGPLYFHYIHFPVEASLDTEEHFHTPLGYLYTLPLRIVYYGRGKRPQDGVFLANSRFTAKEILSTYSSLEEGKVRVLYPPCHIADGVCDGLRDLDVVSVGSFTPDKRQIEQIEIAGHLREYSFTLVGGIKSRLYFSKCRHKVERDRLTNVKLWPNAPKEVVRELFSRAKVFLHTKRNEHFGISSVEAIGHGCIPIVHDSGGSREVVPAGELRFRETGEAIQKLAKTIEQYRKAKDDFSHVRDNINKYSPEKFHLGLSELLFKT